MVLGFAVFAFTLGLSFGAGAFAICAPAGVALAVVAERRRASAHRTRVSPRRLLVAVALVVMIAGLASVVGGSLSTDSPGGTELVR